MRIAHNSKGFTLTEIMIVVGIIGLLAAIAIPSFAQASTHARNSTCINNMRIIESAKAQYAIQNNVDEGITPETTDLTPYLKGERWLTCPKTGTDTYSINPINTKVVCMNGHVLP